MTLGQRIQELRKKQGLSQEALGEKLGVSRQAISRWEMDGAVPEVDKLIALSQLFGMPVDQLLGVEEAGKGDEQDAGELTGRELKVVRAVADRYLEGNWTRRERWKKALWLGAALAGALALVFVVYLFQIFDRLERLSGRLDGMERQVNGINSSIDSQVSSALSRMEAMMAQGESLVERWDYTLDRVETEGLRALTVEVVPRTYEAGMSALLTLTPEGGQAASVQGEWDGQAFQFPIKLYASSHVEGMLSLIGADGGQQTQALPAITDLAARTRMEVSVLRGKSARGWTMLTEAWEGRYEISWRAEYARADTDLDLRPSYFQLRLVKNGAVIQRWDSPMEALPDSAGFAGNIRWEESIPLEHVLRWCMEDTLGQVYQGEVFRFTVVQGKWGLEARQEAISTQAVPYF